MQWLLYAHHPQQTLPFSILFTHNYIGGAEGFYCPERNVVIIPNWNGYNEESSTWRDVVHQLRPRYARSALLPLDRAAYSFGKCRRGLRATEQRFDCLFYILRLRSIFLIGIVVDCTDVFD